MTQPLTYSIVIVEYFSQHHLVECLRSIVKQTHQAEKVVVVINGMDEEIRREITTSFDVHLIDPHHNLGYSRAANLGIANTESDVVLTLNPDTVLDPECSEQACTYLANNPEVGAVGPKIFETNGEVYPSARNEPRLIDAVGHGLFGMIWRTNPFTRRYKNLNVDNTQTRNVDWLSGAAQYLRRRVLDEVGGWDEDFFMYCEDIDLGRRIRQAGFVNSYVPEAELTHVQGVSTDRAPKSLIIAHHKSLYIYSRKKYRNNIAMQFFTAIFIGFRLPVALVLSLFRIN